MLSSTYLSGKYFGQQDVKLDLRGPEATGRYGRPTTGKDVHLTQKNGVVSGRIGTAHPGDGKDVDLKVGDAPLEVAALLALCTYKLMEDIDQYSASVTAASL